MNIITINIRTIPEIQALFRARPNKKDSFQRWWSRTSVRTLVTFKADGHELDAVEA